MILTCDGRSPTNHPFEDLLGGKESEESAGASLCSQAGQGSRYTVIMDLKPIGKPKAEASKLPYQHRVNTTIACKGACSYSNQRSSHMDHSPLALPILPSTCISPRLQSEKDGVHHLDCLAWVMLKRSVPPRVRHGLSLE